MIFEVSILGSNAALPAYGRHLTAQVLNHNNHLFLIDCGDGTQLRLSELQIKRSKINQIFISHLHGDHCFGLPGILTSYSLLGREKRLQIFSPPGLKNNIETILNTTGSKLSYEIEWFEIDQKKELKFLYENKHLQVYSFPVLHKLQCVAYVFIEKEKDRKIIKEKIEPNNLTINEILDLKAGKDIKRNNETLKNEDFTFAPAKKRSYVFCTDTAPFPEIYDYFKNSGIEISTLYHEATFLHKDEERAVQTFHTTAKQAGEIALQLNANKLLIGHFSAKYNDLTEHLTEAKAVFENTFLAEEGLVFSI